MLVLNSILNNRVFETLIVMNRKNNFISNALYIGMTGLGWSKAGQKISKGGLKDNLKSIYSNASLGLENILSSLVSQILFRY
jgi:hypothetical protein